MLARHPLTRSLLIAAVAISGTLGIHPTLAAPDQTHPASVIAQDQPETVQQLHDLVNAAWPEVTSYRVTSMSGTVPDEGAESTPLPDTSTVIEEWAAPNNRRITEIVNGEVVNEQVFVDGQVYMRGDFVVAAVAPEVSREQWVILNPDVVPADTPVGYRVAYLMRDAGQPFGSMTPELLKSEVVTSGTVTVGERSCDVYVFGDTTNSGDKIRFEVALDENDLPCQVVQRAGGFQNSSVYEINPGDLQIVSPDSGHEVSGTPEG